MKGKKLNVALVGAGGISGAHIPAWEAMEETQQIGRAHV